MPGLRAGGADPGVCVAVTNRVTGRRHPPRADALGALFALLCSLCAAAETAVPPFSLTPPPALRGPQAATTLFGATYTWLPARYEHATRLMITTMPAAAVRAELGAITTAQCLQMFVDELRASHSDFFVVAMKEPLALGDIELARYRWNGRRDGRDMTGVLACGELAGYYYVVHYVDELAAALETFPAIRASLGTLVPTGTP